jgi:hypothetical protein
LIVACDHIVDEQTHIGMLVQNMSDFRQLALEPKVVLIAEGNPVGMATAGNSEKVFFVA